MTGTGGKRRKSSSPSNSTPAKRNPQEKLREILQQLKKVDSVTMEVRSKMDELDSWKLKLEEQLYSYLNENSNANQQSAHSNQNPNKAGIQTGGSTLSGSSSSSANLSMNSPINLGHSRNTLPLPYAHQNYPNPINQSIPNNYAPDFNPEQLLGLGGQLGPPMGGQNGPPDPSSWLGYHSNVRIPSLPTTSGLFNPTHFPNPHLMMLNNKERT